MNYYNPHFFSFLLISSCFLFLLISSCFFLFLLISSCFFLFLLVSSCFFTLVTLLFVLMCHVLLLIFIHQAFILLQLVSPSSPPLLSPIPSPYYTNLRLLTLLHPNPFLVSSLLLSSAPSIYLQFPSIILTAPFAALFFLFLYTSFPLRSFSYI